MLPLSGITVVSLEQAVAAPFATRQLADLGARVIKIERPGAGDFARSYDATVHGLSSHFVWLNRNKESFALDVKAPGQRQILDELLARADVFVQNLAPGAAERLGLGAERLLAEHPRLIVCGISGYGTDGPYRDKKAYDLLVQCETGVPALTGTPDQPAKTGIPVADIAGGTYAYSGVLSALYERERTGRGQAFEVSLFDALTEWVGFPLYYTVYGGTQPARTGLSHAAIAPYGPFTCGDGETVFLAVQNDREWRRLCADVLEQPELAGRDSFATNDFRSENRDELRAVIEAAFSPLDSGTVLDRLDAASIANARLRGIAQLAEHPQLAERGRWGEVGSPAGPLRSLLPPVTVAGREPRLDPIPDVGEHNAALLAELGYDAMPD
ncbi:CaiB/BaiF CoA transferase family protein [Amycolatopsis saalfeldensis]|uniref:Crotonobetainyl-CoA:carnitine CoA-transferase CaiB n=1 Tax=Amycolatopsis saalfeldensis TaxID=394193 RepID=A0A1H8QN02_9PSEU|nr:CaiB/BaiF CoA-transferase family protein [Amycolatopsis saalfeldensis]SEO55590.1 Crotonobetainyl-CoA:carnitine CoA-transferase CaiB [Amycolatopsis saalfeldensis]